MEVIPSDANVTPMASPEQEAPNTGTEQSANGANAEIKQEVVTDPANKQPELSVEFFIGEARKNSNNSSAQQTPDATNFNNFKRKFIEEHQNALEQAGNADVSLEFNLSEEEVEALSKRLQSVFTVQKSPIQILNELFPGGQKVKIVDKGCFGAAHEPLHITCVHIENIGSFLGKAKSKQDAKQFGARMAIGFLNQLKFSYYEAGLHIKQFTPKLNKNKKPKTSPKSAPNASPNKSQHTNGNGANSAIKKVSNNNNGEQIAEPIEEFQVDFEKTYNIPKESFIENEISKAIFNAIMEKSSIFGPDNINQLIENSTLAGDKSQYTSQDLWRFKEIAGFVLVSDLDQSVQVVSLGTGTKCISSEYLSLNGDVVHDCHAEIVARRGLLCVLYEHLQALLDNELQDKPEFILEPRDNGDGFRLKKHLKLHLYVSSPPCGDARLFNFVENKNNRNRFVKGILRVKVEKGQGAIPMELNYISTWDGILTSCQRCTLMSCSDKITLWNVVGVQGSLLSFFLEPIYIEGLVVSRLFRPPHILRSLHGRVNEKTIEPKLGTDSLYRLNKHKIGFFNRTSNGTKDTQALNPVFSHNWHSSFDSDPANAYKQIEMIKAESGRNFLTENESRLSKHSLLNHFKRLVSTRPHIPSIIPYEATASGLVPNLDQMDDGTKKMIENLKDTYAGLKSASKFYKNAKIALFSTLKESGLGSWVTSPVDVDLFLVNQE